jgi:hypothetical protein
MNTFHQWMPGQYSMMIAIIRPSFRLFRHLQTIDLIAEKADDRFKMANKIPAKIGNNDEM